jgi:hypothetical protein
MGKFELNMDLGRFMAVVQTRLYSSPAALVDELVQNSSRAKATTLTVEIANDWKGCNPIEVMQFRDNGVGLSDPDKLLSMATSGWDDETQSEEDPFGLGFWSVAGCAGTVVVRSRDWLIKLDVEKMRRTHSVDIVEVERTTDWVAGFEVTLTSPSGWAVWNPARLEWLSSHSATLRQVNDGLDLGSISAGEERACAAWYGVTEFLSKHVASAVRYSEFESVRFRTVYGLYDEDGSTAMSPEGIRKALAVERNADWGFKELEARRSTYWSPKEQRGRGMTVRKPGMHGSIWPQKSFWDRVDGADQSGVALMYQNRLVEYVQMPFGGVLHVDRFGVTARAPDRKAFVRDAKFTEMTAMITMLSREMYRKALKRNKLSLEDYDGMLSQVLVGDDLLVVPFQMICDEMMADQEVDVEKIEKEVKAELKTGPKRRSTMSGAQRLKKQNVSPEIVLTDVTEEEETIVEQADEVQMGRYGDLLDKDMLFWVKAVDVPRYRSAVEALREMGRAVLLVSTRVEEAALEQMRAIGKKVISVADVAQKARKKLACDAVDGADKHPLYEDLMFALSKLSGKLGVTKTIVGDLSMSTFMEVDGVDILIKEDRADLVACTEGTKVYVQYKRIESLFEDARMFADPSAYLTLQLLPVLAHERAHHLVKMGPSHGEEHGSVMLGLIEATLAELAEDLLAPAAGGAS